MKKEVMALGLALATGCCLAQNKMTRMLYRHPGGTADLKVGLWAWPIVMDYDGDGDLDLVVSCPCAPYNAMLFFENPSQKGEKNTNPVFKPGRYIGAGQWNVTTATLRGQQVVTRDSQISWDFAHEGFSRPEGIPGVDLAKVPARVWRYVDYDGDGREDLYFGSEDWSKYGESGGSRTDHYNAQGKWTNDVVHGYVCWVRALAPENGKIRWEKPQRILQTDGKPVDVYGNPMPMIEDWDGDGDLDIICGEFIDSFTWFENVGTRTAPRYAPGRKLVDARGQTVRMDIEMITPSAVDWDGDGKMDIICGEESGRVAFLRNTGTRKNGIPVFEQPLFFRQEMDELNFGVLATPCGCDWDGDGDYDLIAGNASGYIGFIENLSGPGVAQPKWAEAVLLQAGGKTIRIEAGMNGSIQGPHERRWGYTTVTVADWDGDGCLDIMANSITGDVLWYRNIGTRTAPKLAPAEPVEVEWEGVQPSMDWGWRRPTGKALLTQWRTTPVMFDWNRDGLMDLVMLDQEGYIAWFERAVQNGKRILKSPKRIFCYAKGKEQGKPIQFARGRIGRSGRRKICLADWNGDGKTDILINARSSEVWQQTEAKDGKYYFFNTGCVDNRQLQGHTSSPTVVDFDGNKIPDILIGAEDGFFYFLTNPRAEKQ